MTEPRETSVEELQKKAQLMWKLHQASGFAHLDGIDCFACVMQRYIDALADRLAAADKSLDDGRHMIRAADQNYKALQDKLTAETELKTEAIRQGAWLHDQLTEAQEKVRVETKARKEAERKLADAIVRAENMRQIVEKRDRNNERDREKAEREVEYLNGSLALY